MNHTTQRFPRTLRSIDGTSCLGIDGPIIPTRPGWVERLVRWIRGGKPVQCRAAFNYPDDSDCNAVDAGGTYQG